MGGINQNVPADVAGQWGTHLEYNGSAFETVRSNLEQSVLSSATRSATVTSADLTNFNASGAIFFLNVSSVPGSGSTNVALVIQGKDPVSGNYATLFTGGTASTGTVAVMFHPGISASANGVAAILPRTFRVMGAVSAGATSKDIVFSVGMSFVR